MPFRNKRRLRYASPMDIDITMYISMGSPALCLYLDVFVDSLLKFSAARYIHSVTKNGTVVDHLIFIFNSIYLL